MIPRYARSLNWLIFFGCLGLLAAAYVMQYGFDMQPCKLCMFQRVTFMAIAVVAFLAALTNPDKIGRAIWGVLLLILTGCGIALSWRHLYLQGLPADQVPDCGPSLEYMIKELHFPISKVIVDVLNGSGDCAEISWRFLGLTIPGWTMIAFIGIAIFVIVANFIARKQPA